MNRSRGRAVRAGVVAAALLAPLGLATVPSQAQTADCSTYPWMDTALSPQERTDALLEASSLEQTMRWLVEQPATQPERTEWPDDVVYPAQLPCTPDITFANGPQGLNAGRGALSTAFPVPIAEAATWDESISHDKGRLVAAETFRAGRNVLLGPGMAGGRNPLSGRTSEYYGEDPVLSGALGAANASGLESLDDMPVLSNLKHYVANEQELDRDLSSSNVDERTRRQIYDLSFEIAAKESGSGSIMCSYNQVNGTYACENEHLLTGVVKGDWGYDGFVMSDFGSVHSTAASLDAGLDMELNRPVWYTPDLLHAALDAGEIDESQIEAAATRVVRTFIDTGLFDTPLPAEPETQLITAESRALALEMAEKGSVLLANDGLLPLADGLDVAVIGPWASETPTDEVSANTVCSSTLRFTSTRTAVACPDVVSPLEALEARVAADGGSVTFDGGADPVAAAALAAEADVALVFGYYTSGEFDDIADLRLDGNGDALISAVAAANPDTVVVTAAGSAVEMPWLDDVAGVLHTWYPGLEMGTAISNLLWGDTNPSGKLPMTFPRSYADTPTAQSDTRYPGVFADGSTERTDDDAIRQVEYSEGLQVGYRWYQAQGIEPLFEFGHGLSYTSFEYAKPRVTPRKARAPHIDVAFRVSNTGDVAGTEVAQVYLELPDAAGEPFRRLIAWERVELEPGEHENVRIRLDADELATRHLLQYWDDATDGWVTPSGTYTVHVGSSSEELPLQETVTVR